MNDMSTTIRISNEIHKKMKGFARKHGIKIARLGEYFVVEGLKQVEKIPVIALAMKIEHELGKESSGGMEIERVL